MEIVVQDFFLEKVKGDNLESFIGNMKIFLPEKKIQILGIQVKKNNENWFFMIPGTKRLHHQTGKIVGFPFIIFSDKEEKILFFKNLKENAITYIIKRMQENSLKLPVTNEKYMAKNKNKSGTSKKIQSSMHKK